MDQEEIRLKRKERKARKNRFSALGGVLRKVKDALSVRFLGLKKISLNPSKLSYSGRAIMALTLALGLFAAGIYLGLSSAEKELSQKGLPLTNSPAGTTADKTDPGKSVAPVSEPNAPANAEPQKKTGEKTQSQAEGNSAVHTTTGQGTSSTEASAKKPPELSHLEWPLEGEVVKSPGPYFSPELNEWKFFEGIAIKKSPLSPVKVVLPGSVKSIVNGPFGLSIVVSHGFGIESTYVGVMTDLQVGDEVTKNQVIGKTQGDTLIFTIRDKNDYKDPREVLRKPGN